MQLPGMNTDFVRVSLDLTWDPIDNTFSMSRRLWTRPPAGSTWLLEDMATTGTPLTREGLACRWETATELSLRYFTQLVEQSGPFGA